MAKKHARFSPSMLPSLDKCIRFKWRETEAMDEAADEGTLLHHACETGSLAGLDDYQKADVEKALGYVEALKAGMTNPREYKETQVELKDLTFGTLDRALLDQDNRDLHIIDFKFVRVETDHDFQLMTYAAALVETLANEGTVGYVVNRVYTHVVAPRLGKAPEVQEFDAAALVSVIRHKIETLYERIENPFNAPCADDPTLCARCARTADCPAVNAIVVASAPHMGLPLPEVFAPDAMVSVRDRSLAQQLAGLFENWAEAVKKANTAFVQQGGEIPGYKLQSRSTGFRIPREATLAAAGILQEKLNLDVADILGASSLSIPELAKAMAETRGGKEQDLKAQLIDELRDVGVQGSCSFLTKAGKGKK